MPCLKYGSAASQTSGSILAKGLEFVKLSPVASFLMGLILLGVVLPPRKRKRRVIKAKKRKRSKKTKVVKTKTRRGRPKKTIRTRPQRKKPARQPGVPSWMVKGSPAAKTHMRKLRLMRTGKKSKT